MTDKHSVLLKEEECEGCTNCVKNCPTRAIRVHQGKASIKDELCIDCAECIRTCEYHAKYTKADSLKRIKNFSHPVALVPPSFYGQFSDKFSPFHIISALKKLGFAEVRNVARAAEALSQKTAEFLNQNDGFYISSSCPVVVRLVQKIYPELVEHLIPLKSPVELMAQRVKKELKLDNSGIFFLTPCPAKLTTVQNSPGLKNGFLDGALAMEMVYEKLLLILKKEKGEEKTNEEETNSRQRLLFPDQGVLWGQSGGEAEILQSITRNEVLSVDGIEEVKNVLDELSRNNISGIRYFELVSCPQGCVGGVLNVCNPYQAKFNLKKLVAKQQAMREQKKDSQILTVQNEIEKFDFSMKPGLEADPRGKLDSDMDRALEKLASLEEEKEALPGLDCASCGAPDCETLAEDIVQGRAQRTDCIFMLRKKMRDLVEQVSSLTLELPPVMSGEKKKKEKKDSLDQNSEEKLEG